MSTSPVIIGRARELALLRRAYETTPTTLLIGGEAGVGKTRLIGEFTGLLGPETRVLTGACLQLGTDGLPFAPFTAALRRLVRDIGAEGVADLLPRGETRELARLLPEFGEPDSGVTEAEARGRLFELVLTLLENLATHTPVVLVVEDAHWADRSTRDLLSFLARNIRESRLLALVTYRSDELHKGHPLRPVLAELDRLERVSRLELTRLPRREVAELVRSLTGGEPEARVVDAVFERSEGNPLFVEALVGCDGELVDALPESLRDLLLGSVQRLPEETQELLRVASAAGSVDHRLLAVVSGLDDAALDRSLRPAVAGNVLTVDGEGYAFRHALIREAVHDDLLPGEHSRLHARFAEALEADPGLVPAGRAAVEIAHHWSGAHNLTWALTSSWQAAKDAHKAAAFSEELQLLDRVQRYWDQVPDAAERIRADHLEVIEHAVHAADAAGDYEVGVKLTTAGLRETTDPLRSAHLLEHRGQMSSALRRGSGVDDLRRAVALLPADPPTADRASALATLATQLFKLPNGGEARRAAEEAVRVARQVGDAKSEALASLTIFCTDASYVGRDEEIDGIEAVAQRSGAFHPILRVAVTRSHHLEGSGRHEEATRVARAGIEQAGDFGLSRVTGTFLAINLAEPLISLGRWDEAGVVIEHALDQDPPPGHRAALRILQAEISAARGDLAAATALVDAARPQIEYEQERYKAEDYYMQLRVEAAIAMAEGRPGEVPALVSPALVPRGSLDEPRYGWPLMLLAAGALLAIPAEDGRDDWAAVRARAADLGVSGPVQCAYRDTFAAHAIRVEAHLDTALPAYAPAAWTTAIAAWESLDQPYALARTLYAAAEAQVTAHRAAPGDDAAWREVAGERLRRAAELAADLKALPLADAVADLAQRARLTETGEGRHGLTPRELEVLRLVAEGRTNREIAETLYISPKTASVHVSNIIAKLGVTTRTEAAAQAHRRALLTP